MTEGGVQASRAGVESDLSSRKELLQSTTKFTNDNLSTLTLCTTRASPLMAENHAEIKHLNLLNFKIFKCEKQSCGDQKNCLSVMCAQCVLHHRCCRCCCRYCQECCRLSVEASSQVSESTQPAAAMLQC